MVVQKKQGRKLFMHHYPSTHYTNQHVQDHTINRRCHENLKSLQKPVQLKINKPALLEVQTVNNSSVWNLNNSSVWNWNNSSVRNLNNKNGASLLKAVLLLMSSVLML
jgi:hypothetical protein